MELLGFEIKKDNYLTMRHSDKNRYSYSVDGIRTTNVDYNRRVGSAPETDTTQGYSAAGERRLSAVSASLVPASSLDLPLISIVLNSRLMTILKQGGKPSNVLPTHRFWTAFLNSSTVTWPSCKQQCAAYTNSFSLKTRRVFSWQYSWACDTFTPHPHPPAYLITQSQTLL